jgi:hypothetical protein
LSWFSGVATFRPVSVTAQADRIHPSLCYAAGESVFQKACIPSPLVQTGVNSAGCEQKVTPSRPAQRRSPDTSCGRLGREVRCDVGDQKSYCWGLSLDFCNETSA